MNQQPGWGQGLQPPQGLAPPQQHDGNYYNAQPNYGAIPQQNYGTAPQIYYYYNQQQPQQTPLVPQEPMPPQQQTWNEEASTGKVSTSADPDDKESVVIHNQRLRNKPSSEWRDLPCLLLFVFTMLLVAGLSITCLVITLARDDNDDKEAHWFADSDVDVILKILICCGICAVAGSTLSVVWLVLMRYWAKQLIIISIVASVALTLAAAVVFLIIGSYFAAIILFIMAALWAFLYFMWRRRIPFAAAMLELVSEVIQAYPATVRVSFFFLVLQIIWTVVWGSAAILTQFFSPALSMIFGIFMIFSFYWTSQILKNIVHVTTCGTAGSWYFLYNSPTGMPSNPTLGALKRATTTSLGSICFGSLIVAILNTLKALANALQNSRADGIVGIVLIIVGCIASFILGILESLAEYFNMYAFAQVAIYGKTYIQSSKDTWQLFKTHGFEAIVNDNLIGNFLTLAALASGAITAVLGGIIGIAIVGDSYWLIMAILGFFIGFVMVLIVLEVVHSAVVCIFVCFAEDPQIMAANHPHTYELFSKTYGDRCDLFSNA